MFHVRRFATLVALSVAAIISAQTDSVILDDFSDHYVENTTQCHLGEAYGYFKYGDEFADSGNGWWSPFADALGSEVYLGDGTTPLTSGGEGVNDDATQNAMVVKDATNPKDSYLHVHLKTHNSTDIYPFAGLSCDLLKGANDYFDFSSLEEIYMEIKTNGTVRFNLHTKDIVDLGKAINEEWGYYGYTYTPEETGSPLSTTSEWEKIPLTVDLFEPDEYSPAAESLWTWDHGKTEVKNFNIEIARDSALHTDEASRNIELMVRTIVFKGLSYNETFGFDLPDIGIINVKNGVFARNNFKIIPQVATKNLAITYTLENSSNVAIKIFDLNGRELFNKDAMVETSGSHTVNTMLPSGTYVAHITLDNSTITESFSFLQ